MQESRRFLLERHISSGIRRRGGYARRRRPVDRWRNDGRQGRAPRFRTTSRLNAALVVLLIVGVVGAGALQFGKPLVESPAAAGAPPGPDPEGHAGFADDFALFGLSSAPNPHAAFHGHASEFPTPVTAPGAWSSTDGGVATSPNTSHGDVAFSREGFPVAVWSSYWIGGFIICDQTSDPGDEFPQPQNTGRIYGSRWNGTTWEPPIVLVSAGLDEWYGAVTLSFDASGKFILGYQRSFTVRGAGFNGNCALGPGGDIRGRLYWGGNLTYVVGTATVLDGPWYVIPQVDITSTMIPQLAPAGLLTMNRGMVSWILPVSCAPPAGGPFYYKTRHSHWDGDSFEPTVQYPATDWVNAGRQIESSTDKLGNTLVVWGAVADGNGDSCDGSPGDTPKLYDARHTGAGWSSSSALDPLTDVIPDPAISFQYDDVGVVVYTDDQEGDGQDIWALTWHDGDVTFLGKIDTRGMKPRIASDHFDRTVAAWFDTTAAEMQFRTFNGSTWSAAGVVPGLTTLFAAAGHSGSPSTTLAEWSFFAYMCEDTDPPLTVGPTPAGQVDLGEMETVGSTSEMNVVALLDKVGVVPDERMLYVKRGAGSSVTRGDWPHAVAAAIDMGAPATLTEAIAWMHEMYPANRTLLDIWDHGLAWRAVCVDAQNTVATGDDTDLDMPDLSTGLGAALGPARLDVLGFDACCMANIEVAYQIRNFADYEIGSETVEPDPGWPYDWLLADLAADHRKTPRDLAQAAVVHYRAKYLTDTSNSQAEMLSAIDLDRVRTGPLIPALNTLGVRLDEALATEFAAVNASVQIASQTDCDCMTGDLILDLKNFSKEAKRNVVAAALDAAADLVIAEVPNVAYYYWNGSDGNPSNRPVGWNGSMGTDYFGISIYHANTTYDPAYNATAFAGATFWDTYNWNFRQTMVGGPVIVPESGALVAVAGLLVVAVPLLARRRRARNSP